MLGFVITALFVGWAGVSIFLLAKASISMSPIYWGILVVWLIATLGWVLQKQIQYEEEYPCVEYETKLRYNPATKTTMPMRICVLRGKWVED